MSDLNRDILDFINQQITRLQPATTLLVGDCIASVVQVLRQHHDEVFGLDTGQAHDQAQLPPFCRYGSVADPLSQSYQLIIWFESYPPLSAQQIEQALVNFCGHSQVILFFPATKQPLSEHSPDYWVEHFAHFGFFRDIELGASELGMIYFRQDEPSLSQLLVTYERRLGQLERELQTYQARNAQLQQEIVSKDETLLATEARLVRFEGSLGWALLQKMQLWRSRLFPLGSIRDQALEDLFRAWQTGDGKIIIRVFQYLGKEFSRQAKQQIWKLWLHLHPPRQGRLIEVAPLPIRPPLEPHSSTVNIIICIHNALADVLRCLESVEQWTSQPYGLILVDDGSEAEASVFLKDFAQTRPNVTLLRNDTPQGYTRAANQGLHRASAEYIVLLNSDTIVTAGWLDRLVACANSDPRIGLVGPLSNTASWQSIPEVFEGDDWAANLLPPEVSLEAMGELVARYSARLYPPLPFLNGFCLLIRRQVIQEIGYFDEENFGAGYGEENDYLLMARKAGWQAALADDAYVYHAQSKSYSHERRKVLSERASLMLAKKHGAGVISKGLSACRQDWVLAGIRARSRVMFSREAWLKKGQAEFGGRSLLIVLPVLGPGGGAHVVINEAMAIAQMGLTVHLFNLATHQSGFEQSYPDLKLPIRYGTKEDLVIWAAQYDAVVATANFAVEWLAPISGKVIRGYYVQEFEPYIYPPGSTEFQRALASYTLFPDLIRFTKTDWTRQEVSKQTGADSQVIGVSLNLDLFRPRPHSSPAWPEGPLKITAMVRLLPAYRNAGLTMEILRKVARHYGAEVEINIFGISLEDPGFARLPHDFAWNLAGILPQRQIVSLLNEADIFVDFSSHQAMGLTALEAMACGAAVIVPTCGGASSFAHHEENSLAVDTASPEACWQAMRRLVEDHKLRLELQRQAIVDVCQFFPERPAFNILATLFAGQK